MLAILVSHIIITACCLWSGFLFYRIFSSSQKQISLIQYAISGLILLTGITQVAVIFIPADGFYTGILILLLVLLVLTRKQDFKKFLSLINEQLTALPLLSKLFFMLLWLMILIINSGPVMMDDTESYHIQMIKWLQEYGTVPGIANLHERFGFNSSWFSSVAMFSTLPGKMDLFTVLNGVLSVWFCFYAISALSRLKNENRAAPALSLLAVLVMALISWPMIRGNAATANYDFIATLIIVVLFTETFFNNDAEKKNQPGIEWLIWPVYLFTVRITNYPFLLLSLFSLFYIYKYQKPARIISLVGLCFLLVVPFLTRNFIISGYIFYPSAYFDWFPADWKADPAMMENLVEYIRYYNRVPTTFQDIDVTQSLGATGWIPEWFRYLYAYDKLIVIPGVIGLIAGVFLFFKKKSALVTSQRFLLATMIITTLLWFITAPDPRFIYGCLLAGVFCLAFFILQFIKPVWLQRSLPLLLVLISVCIAFYSVKKISGSQEYRNWLTPASLPQPPVQEVKLYNITIRIPEAINNNWNARCYDTELPCLYRIDPRLKARGKTIREGFRLEK